MKKSKIKVDPKVKEINEIIKSEERDNLILREKLVEVLSEKILVVEFTKKDGTKRELECTLNIEFIPAVVHDVKTKLRNYDVLPVLDVKTNEWRSFRLDSVNYVTE